MTTQVWRISSKLDTMKYIRMGYLDMTEETDAGLKILGIKRRIRRFFHFRFQSSVFISKFSLLGT